MKGNTRIPKWLIIKCKYLILICVFYYLVTWRIGCPFRLLFGIPCPGCGITRAWLCALRLDFSRAFSYHPLFLPALFFPIYFLLEDRPKMHKYQWFMGILSGIFLLVWFFTLSSYDNFSAQWKKGLLFLFLHS